MAAPPLRICADPDNLPFSNRAGAGFDDRIIMLVAHDSHREPSSFGRVRGAAFFASSSTRMHATCCWVCPPACAGVAVTEPYYTSSYAFVTPARKHLQIASFTDERLNGKRIGLQILEEDLSPPSLPLIRSGHAAQIVGFQSFGRREGDVVQAVADGRVGVAVVWGPVAGYFAHISHVPLTVTPVPAATASPAVPFTYSMGFGVHPQDQALVAAAECFDTQASAQDQSDADGLCGSHCDPREGGTMKVNRNFVCGTGDVTPAARLQARAACLRSQGRPGRR